jgi:hypothetical protein
VNRPKKIGTAAEVEIVKAAARAGVAAHRTALAGINDVGDVWIDGGRIVAEVKAGEQARKPSWPQIARWHAEADLEAGRVIQADAGILIVKRWGSGRAEDWTAHLTGSDLNRLTGGNGGAPHLVAIRFGDLLDLIAGTE